MAKEITVSASLSFAKGLVTAKAMTLTGRFDVTGKNYVEGTQSIATDATAIDLAGITTAGWFAIRNMSTANYVEILNATDGAVLLKLLPGEFAIGRFGCAAPAGKANTAAVDIEFLIVEA